MKAEVRFGVIGCGNVANNYYLPYIAEVAQLVVTCDKIIERAKRSAELWGAKKYYDDPDKVFSDPDVDAVVITTSHASHAELAIKAAEAGKHMIVQKPLAVNMKDLEGVISAVRKSGVKAVFEPSQPFFSPIMKRIKELIEEGTIGRPAIFISYTGHSGPTWSDWFFKAEKGGGVIYDLAVYGIADSVYLFGKPMSISATASIFLKERKILRPEEHTKTIAPEYYKKQRPMYYHGMRPSVPVKVTAYDNSIISLLYKEGLISVIFGNYVTFTKLEMPTIQVYGQEGSIVLMNAWTGEIKVVKGGKEEVVKVGRPRPYYEESVDHLIECIRDDKEPLPYIEWGRTITEIMIKAHEAVEKAIGL